MSAMPMGAPGWPEFACCTASMASARIAFAIRESLAIGGSSGGLSGETLHFTGPLPSPRSWIPASAGMTHDSAMQGLHLTADLYRCRCDAAWLTDADQLGEWCVAAVQS